MSEYHIARLMEAVNEIECVISFGFLILSGILVYYGERILNKIKGD